MLLDAGLHAPGLAPQSVDLRQQELFFHLLGREVERSLGHLNPGTEKLERRETIVETRASKNVCVLHSETHALSAFQSHNSRGCLYVTPKRITFPQPRNHFSHTTWRTHKTRI